MIYKKGGEPVGRTIIENKFIATTDRKMDEILKTLQALEKGTIKINLAVDDGKLKKIKNIETQLIELEKKKAIARHQGYSKTVKLLDRYITQVKEGKRLTQAQIAMYDLEMSKEKMSLETKLKADKERIRSSQNVVNQQTQLRSQVESMENKIIANNLNKRLKMSVTHLKKKSNLTINEVKKLQKDIDRVMAKKSGSDSKFMTGFTDFMVFRQVSQVFQGMISDASQLEEAIFQMGIVGGKTVGEIRGLRSEMANLGSEIPTATEEIVKQITAIERTGRSFAEAMSIMRMGTKLSVSSGESLTDSIDITNKSMQAMNIQVENMTDVMNALHTVTLKTPLDLMKISSSMKNAGGAMRNFIESTSKSGQELEGYKQRILEFTLAMTGGQVMMGRTANSAGVSIRTLGTKLIVMQDSAKKAIDEQLALNNAMHEGNKVTADYLSVLAREDLPKAVELLSQLYKTGQLTAVELSKAFTGKVCPSRK